MDLIVESAWKANGETLAVVRYPNTAYKNLEDMQNTLMKRFKNKKVYYCRKTYDGIINFAHKSPIGIQVTLE